ncbi:nicotianamine synthase 3-like [Canna indica]|uniref:Nicotianamine synthase n=1 Tax=Canna indica TaxID=4628 RepID=A0AAQ3QLS4_9LILI|nr:nicotianamine synthase 3-like [Canna indica]
MAANREEMLLVQKISQIHDRISKLPSLTPSQQVNELFAELVLTCIPPISIDVSKLCNEAQEMRRNLIKLCGEAECLLESHFSDVLASFDNPLDHLHLFPYYSNYLKLSHLEFTLLSRHAPSPPARAAFVGSGPLPLSSLVLAVRHMPAAELHNYDVDPAANSRARRLVRGDPGAAARLAFHTADVLSVTDELGAYDVVFLAALVGVGREEKVRAVEHLARHMAPGAILVARSAHGARAFLYPVVKAADMKGFEVLTVYHPVDEVINSVVVARKTHGEHEAAGGRQAARSSRGFASAAR